MPRCTGATWRSSVSGRPAGLAAPSLLTLYDAPVDYDGRLVVALSQSGATPEIVTVCERLRSAGARTVAIVNDAASPLATAAEAAIAIDVGAERAVPATKTVTGPAARRRRRRRGARPGAVLGGRPRRAPDAVRALLADPEPAAALAERLAGAERLFVVARGLLHAAALEAALKIKETTRILAEGISAADFRHGPIGGGRAATSRCSPSSTAAPAAEDVRGASSSRERGAPLACAVARLRGAAPTRTAGGARRLPGRRPRPAACAGAGARPRADPDAPAGLSKSPQPIEEADDEETDRAVHVARLQRWRSSRSSGSRHAAATTTRARAARRRRQGREGGRRSRCSCPRPRPRATRPTTGPSFEAKVKELCPDCKVIYANASQDPHKQQQQAEAAITKGADVLVLDAVDVKSAAADRPARQPEEHPGDRLRPADPRRRHRRLRVVRQREAGPHPGAVAARQARRPARRASRS